LSKTPPGNFDISGLAEAGADNTNLRTKLEDLANKPSGTFEQFMKSIHRERSCVKLIFLDNELVSEQMYWKHLVSGISSKTYECG